METVAENWQALRWVLPIYIQYIRMGVEHSVSNPTVIIGVLSIKLLRKMDSVRHL